MYRVRQSKIPARKQQTDIWSESEWEQTDCIAFENITHKLVINIPFNAFDARNRLRNLCDLIYGFLFNALCLMFMFLLVFAKSPHHPQSCPFSFLKFRPLYLKITIHTHTHTLTQRNYQAYFIIHKLRCIFHRIWMRETRDRTATIFDIYAIESFRF